MFSNNAIKLELNRTFRIILSNILNTFKYIWYNNKFKYIRYIDKLNIFYLIYNIIMRLLLFYQSRKIFSRLYKYDPYLFLYNILFITLNF